MYRKPAIISPQSDTVKRSPHLRFLYAVFCSGGNVFHFLCAYANLPCYPFSHQEGHIMAALYSAHAMHLSIVHFWLFTFQEERRICLWYKEPKAACVSPLLPRPDLHAGQLIDRVGVMLNLPFPCGPALEKLANDYRGKPFSPRSVYVMALVTFPAPKTKPKRYFSPARLPKLWLHMFLPFCKTPYAK